MRREIPEGDEAEEILRRDEIRKKARVRKRGPYRKSNAVHTTKRI